MYCINCGLKLDDSVKFCPNCGTKQPPKDSISQSAASSASAFETSPNASAFETANQSSAFETNTKEVSHFIANSASSSEVKVSGDFTLVDDSKKVYALRNEEKLKDQGAMGTVSSAIWMDGRSEKKVLLKRLFKPADPNQEKLFSNEGFMSRDYGGGSVAKLYGKGETAEFLFMIMEFYEGKTLDKLITQGAFLKKIQPTCKLVQDILKALGELHRAEVVHRDLKPANIIIRQNGKPVILDLGLACQPGLSDIAGLKKIGTPKYAAPEQSNGKFSCASDIYSVGKIFLEMYAGKVDNASVNSVPMPYRTFVKNCLSADAGKRYANAEDALEAFKALETNNAVKEKKHVENSNSKSSTVTILGYRESQVLMHPAVKIYCNGIMVGSVPYKGKTEITINEPSDLKFSCYYSSSPTYRVNGGEWLLLTWTGSAFEASLTDENSYQGDLELAEENAHVKLIVSIVIVLLVLIYNIGKMLMR